MKFKDKYIFHAGISCFFYLAYGAFTVVLSMYCQDIGMSASNIAYIVSFSPLLAILLQPYIGMLADKYRSPRMVSIMTMALATICMFIFAISRNFWILLLSSGFAVAFMNSVTPLTDRLGVSSPYEFGKIRIWGSVGYAIMAQVSGILYEYISPFANFMAGILGAIIMMICVYMVSDPTITSTNKVQKISTTLVMKELIHNRPFMVFLIISFFFWGVNYANFNYLALFIKSLGGTASQVGTYQLWATLFEIPMILATDYIIKKIKFKHIMMFAVFVSMINFAWYATLPSVNMIIYVFVFKGFSTVLFTMITVRLVMILVDEAYVSTAYGIQAMLGKGLGATIFQLIGGRLIDAGSMTNYYLFLLAGATLAFIFCFMYKGDKKKC